MNTADKYHHGVTLIQLINSTPESAISDFYFFENLIDIEQL
jgi:hypothetical protein